MRLFGRLRRALGGLPNGREPVVSPQSPPKACGAPLGGALSPLPPLKACGALLGGTLSPQPPLRSGAPRFFESQHFRNAKIAGLALVLPLALLTLAACSSNNNNANNAGGGIIARATYKPTAASYTPIPAEANVGTAYPLPSGTPPVGAPDACAAASSGPQQAGATLPPATPIPAFTPGPQPQRPTIDLTKLKLSSGTIPAHEDPFQDGKFVASDIAQTAAYPQYAYAYLETIGLEAGRLLSWTGTPAGGRTPLLTVIYYVFGNDAGASTFLHAPVYPANLCVKTEPGASIGQESSSITYQYTGQLATKEPGAFEGHRIIWRCGRVLLSAEQVGAPGQYSASSVDAIAQKVQQDYLKTQSCS